MTNRRNLTIALIIGLALAGSIAAPMTASAVDNVCMSGGGTAAQNAACPVAVLNCPAGTLPGWLDANGNPTACVDNHPCIATDTQDWLCNPIAPPVAAAPVVPVPVPVVVQPPAKVAAVAAPTPTKAPASVPARVIVPSAPVATPKTPATLAAGAPVVSVAGPTVTVTEEVQDSVWSTCDLVICI
jgi:hypothetical protein